MVQLCVCSCVYACVCACVRACVRVCSSSLVRGGRPWWSIACVYILCSDEVIIRAREVSFGVMLTVCFTVSMFNLQLYTDYSKNSTQYLSQHQM